ncbi:MAG: hypothetical protein PVH59_04630 [Anaerolineae bacterium]
MRNLRLLITAAVLLVVALAACSIAPDTDWTALYSERLGQSVVELDQSTLGQEYIDPASGALTRVAWARMRNNDMVLLGLPPHGLDSEEVVERTVVLSQQEWQNACGDALGEEEIWGWEMNHTHPGNLVRIYINNQRDAYCEFAFLPEGWELRTVQRQGILKPYHQP